jgi:predicted Rossmann-fold nucleotide-binding protein
MFEALTLVQTQKVTRFPVILFGSAYWSGLISWLREAALAGGKINEPDLDLLYVTDDVSDAVDRIVEAEKARSEQDEAEKAMLADADHARVHDAE